MSFEALREREWFSELPHPASDLQMYFTKLDSGQSWGRNLRASDGLILSCQMKEESYRTFLILFKNPQKTKYHLSTKLQERSPSCLFTWIVTAGTMAFSFIHFYNPSVWDS